MRRMQNIGLVSNGGSPMRPVFKLKVQDDGSRELEIVGQYSFYEEIQTHADSVDIQNILNRYANGDISVLNRVASVYGDFTSLPTDLGELSQRILDANDLFNNLSLDVRREFDFDSGKFFNSIGTEKFNSIVEKYTNKDNQTVSSNNNSTVVQNDSTVVTDSEVK